MSSIVIVIFNCLLCKLPEARVEASTPRSHTRAEERSPETCSLPRQGAPHSAREVREASSIASMRSGVTVCPLNIIFHPPETTATSLARLRACCSDVCPADGRLFAPLTGASASMFSSNSSQSITVSCLNNERVRFSLIQHQAMYITPHNTSIEYKCFRRRRDSSRGRGAGARPAQTAFFHTQSVHR